MYIDPYPILHVNAFINESHRKICTVINDHLSVLEFKILQPENIPACMHNLFLVALHVHVQFIPEESSDFCDKLEPVSGLCT